MHAPAGPVALTVAVSHQVRVLDTCTESKHTKLMLPHYEEQAPQPPPPHTHTHKSHR